MTNALRTNDTDPTAALLRDVDQSLSRVKVAARQLNLAAPAVLSEAVLTIAARLRESAEAVLEANRRDLDRMEPANPKYDRLLLSPERIEAIATDLEAVAELPCPAGEILERRVLPNGLQLEKVRVPLGVVAIIFESRPNVTVDVAALCLKSGNAALLKGSRDAKDSNEAIVQIIQAALAEHELPADAVTLAPAERAALKPVLEAVDVVNVAIPRGSQGLIDHVREHARVPVIETGAGIVHVYVDASADVEKARAIVTNSKARRVSVCNALDTLLIHESLLDELPAIVAELGDHFDAEVFADTAAFRVLDGHYGGPLRQAQPEDFGREFLAMKLAIKVVNDLNEALEHVACYSSGHSESVVAEDTTVIETWLRAVDAAAVYANASTAFTDGAQFGMGAEIGISTQKLHARGPMALPELTSYKWLVRGSGQTRQ
ncbi:MAG: glutamate-5-semialdehyde dehydrogenase [Pseudomonadota bacterium]